jgi:hypothetical protein
MKRLVSWIEFIDAEPWRFNLAVTAYGVIASAIMLIAAARL